MTLRPNGGDRGGGDGTFITAIDPIFTFRIYTTDTTIIIGTIDTTHITGTIATTDGTFITGITDTICIYSATFNDSQCKQQLGWHS